MSQPSVKQKWVGWRNRIISSPAFQSWASRFPLTRPVSRIRARRLFDIIAGFTYSQTLFACVESGIIARLEQGAATSAQLGTLARLGDDATRRLLRAAAALGLIESVGEDLWMLGEQGVALVGNPGAVAMIRHHHLLYADLADPLSLLRGERAEPGALAGYWPYALGDGSEGGNQAAVSPYSQLMAASQPMVADQVVHAFRFGQHRRMLDVGGGSGAFIAAVAKVAPSLEFGLFDLPAVTALGQQQLAAQGVKVTAHPADFRNDAIPQGYDLVTLIRILHDHDDALAQDLLVKVRAALNPGDTLLIAEPMAGTSGAEAMADAYFGFYLLAMGSGRARTPQEIGAMLSRAGFAGWREKPTGLPIVTRVIVATA
jgi:demethylspheroidene O-methyltransferase